MEVSHTPVDKRTPRNVWTTLDALPQRVGSLLKQYESSNAGGFEDFERELHALFAQTECAVTEEALARHDVDLPFVFIDGEMHRRACRCAQTYLTAAGPVSVTRTLYRARRGEVLGDKTVAVTAVSPSLPQEELEEAQEVAKRIGIEHRLVNTDEMDNPQYAANPENRCYFCKSELFIKLNPLAESMGFKHVVYGAMMDDRGDHRPGAQTAQDYEVRAPLDEADLSKKEIRALSKRWDLPTWSKPSFACLSSRVPYGQLITIEKLSTVEQGEAFLRRHDFRVFRVWYHENVARIEVLPADMPRLCAEPLRSELVAHFKAIGYTYFTVDLAGFRSGSMNESLSLRQEA